MSPSGVGDRIAVGIHGRVAQHGGHPLDQRVRDGVLQPLGLVVHRVPGVAEECDQVGLDQPVAPEHAERGAPALGGELHALVGHVLEQSLLREPLDHPAHRGGRKLQRWAISLVAAGRPWGESR